MGYDLLVDVQWTIQFERWLSELRDEQAKGRIGSRIQRLRSDNFGQTRSLGSGLSELKIDYGLGYRVHFTVHGRELVVLLCGGDKSTQERDIKAAYDLLDDLRS